MNNDMHHSNVTTEGIVVTPLRMEDSCNGLFAYFKATFDGIEECDCLAFGELGVEMNRTFQQSDKIIVKGALYCDGNNRRSLYIFDIEKN